MKIALKSSAAPKALDVFGEPATFLERKYMTVEDWFAVPNYPAQRNTEQHAKKMLPILKKSGFLSVHAIVAAVQFPNGALMKINGHTRALLWLEGKIAPPVLIHCDVHAVNTMDDAARIYAAYDNQATGKDSRDNFFGAAQELGMNFQFSVFRQGRGTSALEYAEAFRVKQSFFIKKLDVKMTMREWDKELRLTDAILAGHADKSNTMGPVLAAMLVTLRKHPDEARLFWMTYLERRDGLTSDPDVALRIWLEQRRAAGQTAGRSNAMLTISHCIRVFENFRLRRLGRNVPLAVRKIGVFSDYLG